MHSLGTANWYLPRILDRRLPHLSLEDRAEISQGTDRKADQATEHRLAGI